MTGDLAELVERVWGSFLGRCVRRFLAMSGIDRCVILSSQAFTAVIPLMILIATYAPAGKQDVVTSAVIRKFGLQGEAAAAVTQLFDIPDDATGTISTFSALLLLASGTSFTRRLQTMYRTAWEEEKAGVRGGAYAALALVVLLAEMLVLYVAGALVRSLPISGLLTVPLSLVTGLLLWTSIPYLLLNRQVHWRRLVVGGVLAAVATSAYAVATSFYMPDLMERYTQQFGLFGITMALIGWLLAIAAVLVVSAAVGAEFDRSHARWALALKDRFGLEDPGRARPVPTTAELEAGLNADDLRLLGRVLVDWGLLTAAVAIATTTVSGIDVTGGVGAFFLVSLVLGLVNALIGAVPRLVVVPAPTVTVAVVALLLNAVLLGVTALLSPQLQIESVQSALFGAAVISAVTAVLERLRHPIREAL